MWGPTETKVGDPEEGFVVEKEDLRFLLDQARRRLSGRIGAEDVVSMRCGLRPLAVPKGFHRDVYPLDLSRRHHVVAHEEKRALSLFGGKFTSGIPVAEQAARDDDDSAFGLRLVTARHRAGLPVPAPGGR